MKCFRAGLPPPLDRKNSHFRKGIVSLKGKNVWTILVALTLVIGIFTACGGNNQATQPTPGTDSTQGTDAVEEPGFRVAFIGNQRFGDSGPIDDMVSGAQRAMADFNVQVNMLESIGAANFEADIRAMAGEGYDLVITTFPPMRDAVTMVAPEFPDTYFAGIFQTLDGDPLPNYWNAVFHGQTAMYVAGYMAGQVTQTGRVGLIIGAEGPTQNAEGNAFMEGVRDANPQAAMEFAFVGSYDDPARAFEIASAMIDNGVDVVMTSSAASNAGVVEAALQAEVVVLGEITDFYDVYSGFMGVVGIGFGETVYQAIQMLVEGRFPAGEEGIRDLSNGGYYLAWGTFERFANSHPVFGEALQVALPSAREIEAQIVNGQLYIAFNNNTPNWDIISAQ